MFRSLAYGLEPPGVIVFLFLGGGGLVRENFWYVTFFGKPLVPTAKTIASLNCISSQAFFGGEGGGGVFKICFGEMELIWLICCCSSGQNKLPLKHSTQNTQMRE